jgi:hypothetical protein
MVLGRKKPGKERGFMRKAWIAAVCAVVLAGAPACMAHEEAPAASAEEYPTPRETRLKFENMQNPDYDPAFKFAHEAMMNIYKGTQYDPKSPYFVWPFLSIAHFDLNGDDIPETIATPLETDVEDNVFCKLDTVCPYYVLENRNGKPYILGIIWAEVLDIDKTKNGYWTLKAYTKETPKSEPYGDYFETYIYDKQKDKYVKMNKTGEEKPKP